MTAAKNLEAKEEARLLALKQAARDTPSMDRAEKVIYEKGKGSKMIPRRQTDDDTGLGWEEQQAIAERIGDGVPDWRRLQAAVQQRAAGTAADERDGGDGAGGDGSSYEEAGGADGVSTVSRMPATG
jgi:hypothetical protein